MSGLSWWRYYDDSGRAVHTSAVRPTSHRLTITDTGSGARRFLLELDWSADKRGAPFATLTEAKRQAEYVAERLVREHHEQLVATGVEPPELF